MIELLLLITVVAFVPSDEGYALWDVTVTDTTFIAIRDDRYFGVAGYGPSQFTEQLLRLWEFEKTTGVDV